MRESDAQTVLLVQAVEEVDREGRLLSPTRRIEATSRARRESERVPGTPPPEAGTLILRRAQILAAELESRWPSIARLRSASRLNSAPAAILAACGVLGLLSNVLGPTRRINLLAFPLIGVLAWNLGVYLVLGLSWILARIRGKTPRDRCGCARRLLNLNLRRLAPARWSARSEDLALWSSVTARFLETWRAVGAPILLCRARRLLHLGALTLVLGTIAGMYIRGLAFEYRATWESTFLDAPSAAALLGHLLYPAHVLTGITPPPLEQIHTTDGGNAAPWIHLFAVTALLWVVIPRALLAGMESASLRRRIDHVHLDLGTAYFRRIGVSAGQVGIRVHVVPYSYRPSASAQEHLRELFRSGLGDGIDLRFQDRIDYGTDATESLDETPPLASNGAAASVCHAILFSLAQTPEPEVHGRFLEQWKLRLGERGCLVVLVDSSTLRRRLASGASDARRLEERREAWEKVARAVGLGTVPLDLDHRVSDESIAQLLQAAWPPEVLSEVT